MNPTHFSRCFCTLFSPCVQFSSFTLLHLEFHCVKRVVFTPMCVVRSFSSVKNMLFSISETGFPVRVPSLNWIVRSFHWKVYNSMLLLTAVNASNVHILYFCLQFSECICARQLIKNARYFASHNSRTYILCPRK